MLQHENHIKFSGSLNDCHKVDRDFMTKKIFPRQPSTFTDSNYCSCSCYYSVTSDILDGDAMQIASNDVFMTATDKSTPHRLGLTSQMKISGVSLSDGSILVAKTNKKPEKYKTEICRNYEWKGFCNYGDKCQYAHGSDELMPSEKHPKYKTKLCAYYHTKGICDYGRRCNFIHDEKIHSLP
ncbi:hypothetical protein HZS_8056, partial [Henneguya salminicola]